MNRVILLPSLIIGGILILLYFLNCKKHDREPNASALIVAVLHASGIVCGMCLIVGSVYEEAMKYISGLNLYIFIAGVSLVFVSWQSIRKDILMCPTGTKPDSSAPETSSGGVVNSAEQKALEPD